MAEAAVEENVMNKFFCHKCSVEIPRVLEDYTCPTCLGGFIEELDSTTTSSDEVPSDEQSDDEMDEGASLRLLDILFGPPSGGSRVGEGRDGNQRRSEEWNPAAEDLPGATRYQHGQANPRGFRGFRPRDARDVVPIEHMIQDFIVNLTGVGWGPMGPGGRGNGPVFFLGNPGDYAWGREGLDAIVTQLLNQMDGTGPPPLDKEKIKEIPIAEIAQEQIDLNLQCSVCWEDFVMGENVRKLECEHLYHEPCIIPWLELHGTCPICRKSLSSEEDKSPGTVPDLAALLRAASSSSTSPSSSSTSTSQSQPPDMDFEFD